MVQILFANRYDDTNAHIRFWICPLTANSFILSQYKIRGTHTNALNQIRSACSVCATYDRYPGSDQLDTRPLSSSPSKKELRVDQSKFSAETSFHDWTLDSGSLTRILVQACSQGGLIRPQHLAYDNSTLCYDIYISSSTILGGIIQFSQILAKRKRKTGMIS
jgi:hypothetical protein